MRVSSAGYLVKQGVTGVWKNRMMSFASFCIMLVSLMLVGISVLAGINISRIISGIEAQNEIFVVLKPEVTQSDIDKLYVEFKNISNVTDVTFYSKDQAWADMIADMTEQEREAMQYGNGDNPLPDTFRVKIADLEIMDITSSQLTTFDMVESIQSPESFATALISLRNVAALITSAVVIALMIICLVIISNTTRTSVHARRKEINIMKYVGATNSFIRIPFFIEGMLIGILAAIGALILTRFAYIELYNVITEQLQGLQMMGSKPLYSFSSISTYVTIAYIAAGTVIGALGTTISAGKYLKV